MANSFSKEERVAFENVLEGFNDLEVMARNVKKYNTDSTTMARTGDTIWRPMPYIAQSFSGTDQTGNFKPATQLSVPARLGYQKSAPFAMSATELRDALQEGRLGEAGKQKLASDINVACMAVAATQGTLFVKRTAAATGFDDVAQCDTIMNRIGVPAWDRHIALSSGDYNGMANNLATRGTMTGKPTTAYERALIGENIAGFVAHKLDYANRLAAKTHTGLTISTLVGAGNYYVPMATSTASSGESGNVDNRYQTVTPSATTNVAVGDAITIDGVYEVHHITKESTGELKTFRVISVGASTMVISPPIISAQGGSDAELQYQNCTVTPSASAGITGLNTVAKAVNPFWQYDAIELMPGRYAVPSDAGAAVMRGTTDSGIELVMQKQYDINTMTTFFRFDTQFGVTMTQPEHCGIMMFSQT